MVLFTIGYEGRDVREFFARLRRNAVQVLVDVRQRPNSRKSGFSKHELARAAKRRRINYLHVGDLGTPAELRTYLKNGGSFERFSQRYRAHLASSLPEIKRIAKVARRKRVCFMCYERNPKQCHREILVHKVASFYSNKVQVVNL